jgi:hypothetical protein
MPGTLPHNNFGKVIIKSAMPTITTISISGQRQSKGVPAQYWKISAEYATLTREQFNEVMGFLQQQRGSLYQFDVIIPELSRSSGEIRRTFNQTTTQTVNVSAARAVGSTSIPITSFNTSASGITSAGGNPAQAFRAGDFIKFASHSKVYQIVENAAMSGSSATLNIYPGLIFAVGTSELMTINQVPFQMFNLNDTQEYSYSTGRTNNIVLDLQEAF